MKTPRIGLLTGLDWIDDAEADLLAQRAEAWVAEWARVAAKVKRGQWEGLRRRGEKSIRWEEMEKDVRSWLVDGSDTSQDPRARRAWDAPGPAPGEPGLKDSLMGVIEKASRPPVSPTYRALELLLSAETKPVQDEVAQLLRVRRAQRFLNLLVMQVKRLQEEKAR